jgi:ABC-type multidrug transport system ATPase subunit/pSer/pThr/pTyr-binding forkhead associated (FHA) protein
MKNKWVTGRKWHSSKYKNIPGWARVKTTNKPSLEVYSGDRRYKYTLDRDTVLIGRADDNTIVFSSDFAVSQHHAKIERVNKLLFITDLTSLHGTLVNGKKIKPNERFKLENYDVITVGKSTIKVISEDEGPACITIGRNADSNITLDHPTVSREHARLLKQGTQHVLEDLKSTSGTFVNGERVVKLHTLRNDDVINIGPYKLIYKQGRLQLADEPPYLGIDVYKLQKVIGGENKRRNLLKDISLSIKPGEFVAIVGPSASGKTTLLNALNGFSPATGGRVLINGNDLYANYGMYRNQFGYVPQQNIIHMGLTAYEILNYSARLRLPADTTNDEREKRIGDVLEILKINDLKNHVMHTASGGQLRRVALGVELLAKPGIFFLDEVTSGLDPYFESEMMKIVKNLSELGHHTILLVTHATENIMECDKVVFLARGGYLAYYGPPKDALAYFGVSYFSHIYAKLEQERSPEQWAERYKISDAYHKYIGDRLDQAHTLKQPSLAKSIDVAESQQKRISSWKQFFILSHRNLKILMHDRLSLMLMLMLAPIIGLLDFIFWKQGIFNAAGGDPTRAVINLYMAAIVCFLVGGLASMREIVKETDIYRRERMVFLKILPYVLSKLWVAILISLYSAGVFTAFIELSGHWPPVGQLLSVYVTMALSILAGMVTGLFISSLTRNQNVTSLILLVFLVPQVLFGGIMPQKYYGSIGQAIGTLTTTKWTFQSLVTISDMGVCVADDQCRAEKCSGSNMFTDCKFPGIANYYNSSNEAAAIVAANQAISSVDEQYGSAFNVNVTFNWCVLLSFIAGLLGLTLAVLKLKDNK